MRRISGPNTIDLAPGRPGFRSKDTVAGLPGTVLTAAVLNDWQEEIAAVVEGAGLALSNSDSGRDQLLRAIRRGTLVTVNATRAVSVNDYTCQVAPAWGSAEITVGTMLMISPNLANTGASNLSVNGGAWFHPVRLHGGAPVPAGVFTPNYLTPVVWTSASVWQALPLTPAAWRRRVVAVPSAGVTVTAADENTLYLLDLATRQTLDLPALSAVPAGFEIDVQVINQASGFQTASIVPTGATPRAIQYRGFNHDPLFIVAGEAWRFISVSNGWNARLLAPPASFQSTIQGSSGTPVALATTGWQRPPIYDTPSGAHVVMGVPSSAFRFIRAPVTGVYEVEHAPVLSGAGSSAFVRVGATSVDPTLTVGATDVLLGPSRTIPTSAPADTYPEARSVTVAQGTTFWPALHVTGAAANITPVGSSFSARFVSR
jgi:hypothetical protein